MAYAVMRNSATVAYKERPCFHPRTGDRRGSEGFTEETAYWFEPVVVVSVADEATAKVVVAALEAERRDDEFTDAKAAAAWALKTRASTRLIFYWFEPVKS